MLPEALNFNQNVPKPLVISALLLLMTKLWGDRKVSIIISERHVYQYNSSSSPIDPPPRVHQAIRPREANCTMMFKGLWIAPSVLHKVYYTLPTSSLLCLYPMRNASPQAYMRYPQMKFDILKFKHGDSAWIWGYV